MDDPAGQLLACARWGARFRAYVTSSVPPWRPAVELFGEGLDEVLSRLAADRSATGRGVVGSLLMEQYAQRLVPPVLATWFEDGRVLDARLSELDLVVDGYRIVQVGFADHGEVLDGDVGADVLADRLFVGNLDLAVEALNEATRAGRRVLYGAVAHAVTTSLLALSWPRPDPSHHVATARALLRRHGLESLVRVEAREVSGRRWLYAERRSCCLAFRARVGSGHDDRFCATCPITPEADRHASFVEAASTYEQRRSVVVDANSPPGRRGRR